MKPGGGVREYSGIGAMGQAPIAQWSTNRGVRGARNYLRWLVYPRFHAERGSPTDYRIKYEARRHIGAMMGGFAGSFTVDRTWATSAYRREDRRCEW